MFNILLWVSTTSLYSWLWCLWQTPKSLGEYVWTVAIIAFLSIPFEINGSVWTVLGNARSKQNIFGLLSLYQVAEYSAFSILGSVYQKAGVDAATVVGISIYQKAGNEATTGLGLAIYQASSVSTMLIGLCAYQYAEFSALHYVGIGLCQKSEREVCNCCGFSVYQQVKGASRAFGAFSSLKAP